MELGRELGWDGGGAWCVDVGKWWSQKLGIQGTEGGGSKGFLRFFFLYHVLDGLLI